MTPKVDPSQENRRGSTDHADVWLPRQADSSEHSGPFPRPFALGSITEERVTEQQVVPAPRAPESSPGLWTPSRSGGVLAPPRPAEPAVAPAHPGRGRGRTKVLTTVWTVVAVLAVVMLLAGLYAAKVAREQSPDAGLAAPVAGLSDVTYRVTTANGSPVVVTYSQSVDGSYAAGSATGAPSPWSLDTRVNDYYGPSLTATVVPNEADGGANDTVTCTIVEGGKVVAEQTATGPDASASCFR